MLLGLRSSRQMLWRIMKAHSVSAWCRCARKSHPQPLDDSDILAVSVLTNSSVEAADNGCNAVLRLSKPQCILRLGHIFSVTLKSLNWH